MRQNIIFKSQGLRCSGWLYMPDNLSEGQEAPAIVMAHGFSAVKEQFLESYAERFVDAGFVTMVFDYRYFGESEGEPRGQLFPLEQVEDYRNAITWLSDQPKIDPERIGVWGTSFSGGLVFHLSVFDRRIKALVAQVPSVFNYENYRAMDPEGSDQLAEFLLQDRIGRYKTGEVNYLKVVAPEGEPCVLPGKESYEAFMTSKENAPTWLNGVTLESLEKIDEFDPTRYIHLIAPKPLLIIAAEHDSLIPTSLVAEAYERAREPKDMVTLPCLHYEVYNTEQWFSKAVGAAVDWFKKHLVEKHSSST